LTLHTTQHAEKRCRQRGYKTDDVQTVVELGTPVGDTLYLSRRAVFDKVAEYQQMIAKLERLSGTAVIVSDNRIITIYRPGKAKLRRMSRRHKA
jgi:hypothetical protein